MAGGTYLTEREVKETAAQIVNLAAQVADAEEQRDALAAYVREIIGEGGTEFGHTQICKKMQWDSTDAGAWWVDDRLDCTCPYDAAAKVVGEMDG